MTVTFMPPISLGAADYRDLATLVQIARDDEHPVADFLMAELRRARIQETVSINVVSLGKRVSFRIDSEAPMTRVLVHPADYRSSDRHVSVLSPTGAALLGLRENSRMPFSGADGRRHVVTVLSVGTSATVVDLAQARRLRRFGSLGFCDPDPSAV